MSVTDEVTLPPAPTAPTSAPQPDDYWGFGDTRKWFFPDGVQWIEFKVMNEGEKTKFQRETSRDITLMRNTGDARVKVDAATERHQLIETCVTDWNMYRQGSAVPFSKTGPGATLQQWMQVADPELVAKLEFEIRKANPWLQAEMTTEEIDKQISDLKELREQAEKREQGEASSSSR